MWVRLGLSHPALSTPQGKRLDFAFTLLMRGLRLAGGGSFDTLMLARHRSIDAALARAIDEGRVTQVIELAAGLSPRGYSFARRYGSRITYLETDLPAMAATKRQLLERGGLTAPNHRVVELDALSDTGASSLAAIAATLKADQGTAVITEGLMNYLDPETAQGVWRRIARALGRFPQGLYLSDAYLGSDNEGFVSRVVRGALSRFTGSTMHLHLTSVPQALSLMRSCGFASTRVWEARLLPENADIAETSGAGRVRVLEAWR